MTALCGSDFGVWVGDLNTKTNPYIHGDKPVHEA